MNLHFCQSDLVDGVDNVDKVDGSVGRNVVKSILVHSVHDVHRRMCCHRVHPRVVALSLRLHGREWECWRGIIPRLLGVPGVMSLWRRRILCGGGGRRDMHTGNESCYGIGKVGVGFGGGQVHGSEGKFLSQ